MTLLRALAPAALLMLTAAPVFAQAPWPQAEPPKQAAPAQQQAPWPQAEPQQQSAPAQPSPFPQAGGAQQAAPAEPPCMKQFIVLRDATSQRADAIRAASARKASPQEACGLFKSMVEAETKFAKFAADQGPWCGIPDQIVKQLTENSKKTVAIRTQVCNVAAQGGAAGPRQAAPSLSDSLSAPVTGSGNVKTGRGTFDTLTGTPLGRSPQ